MPAQEVPGEEVEMQDVFEPSMGTAQTMVKTGGCCRNRTCNLSIIDRVLHR